MLVIFVVMLVAIGHIGIMLIEMFASPEQQARAFDLPVEFTRQKEARISFANQGIYNGALGVRCTVDYGVANATSLYHGGGPLRWLYCDKEDLGNTAVTGLNCLFADIVRLIRSWGSSTFPGSFSVWQNKI